MAGSFLGSEGPEAQHVAEAVVRIFGTDGSDPEGERDPRLRRCGWAVVEIDQGASRVIGSAESAWAGARQTVFKAELVAVVFVLRHVRNHCLHAKLERIAIHTDCLSVFNKFQSGPGRLRGSNRHLLRYAEVWEEFWGHHDVIVAAGVVVELVWDRSHKTPEERDALGMSMTHWFSNREADWRAARAARSHSVTAQQRRRLAEDDQLFRAVLNRLVAIELSMAPLLRSLHARPSRGACVRKSSHWPKLRRMMIDSGHVFRKSPNCWSCSVCNTSAVGRSELVAWLRRGGCPGRREVRTQRPLPSNVLELFPVLARVSGRTHKSHRLAFKNGVFICVVCGCYGSQRPKGLRRPCTGRLGSRAAAVRRWERGLHPSPTGVWPQPRAIQRPEGLDVSPGSD